MLSPIQKRIIAISLTTIATLLLFACLLLVFLILRNILGIFSSVIWPLATAFILSMLLHPVISFCESKTKLDRSKATLLFYTITIFIAVAVLTVSAPILINQIMDLIHFLPKIGTAVANSAKEQFPRIMESLQSTIGEEDLAQYQEKAIASLQNLAMSSLPALQQAGSGIFKFFSIVTGAAIIPVYLFYFLESRLDPADKLKNELTFLGPEIREDLIFLINEFISIIVSFFRGQILIGIIMGVLMAIGFTAIGLKFGIILGLTIGLLNIIPYLGSIISIATVLPIAWYQPEGGAALLGLSIGVLAVVQIIEGYLLTPKIMGKQTGLHSMTIIVAIFFWGVALDGLLGMILAIPLTAFFIIAWRLVKRKYMPELTGHGK